MLSSLYDILDKTKPLVCMNTLIIGSGKHVLYGMDFRATYIKTTLITKKKKKKKKSVEQHVHFLWILTYFFTRLELWTWIFFLHIYSKNWGFPPSCIGDNRCWLYCLGSLVFLTVLDEGYSRNESFVLNLIATFLLPNSNS